MELDEIDATLLIGLLYKQLAEEETGPAADYIRNLIQRLADHKDFITP